MLVTNLLPLLASYSLGFDLVAGPDDTVTLTIVPRKADGSKRALEAGEARPISITATATEIDEELGKGTQGALGKLFVARKALGDQLAEQHAAAEHAKTTAAAKAKPAAKPAEKAAPAPTPAPAQAADKPGEPASLW
ncbi:MAG: PRTRC system protein E [Sphingomonadales bacterium]|nr:PRTRC system protein E [Sphingomonadales bacterium]